MNRIAEEGLITMGPTEATTGEAGRRRRNICRPCEIISFIGGEKRSAKKNHSEKKEGEGEEGILSEAPMGRGREKETS